MKIDIKLSKNNDLTAPQLTVSCDVQHKDVSLHAMQETVSFDVPNKDVGTYKISITRQEPFAGTTHATWVKVEEIKIDDFWKIGDVNHWSKTTYDDDYFAAVSEMSHTWELTKDLYNDTLFFNGCLSYEISAPARKMFWA